MECNHPDQHNRVTSPSGFRRYCAHTNYKNMHSNTSQTNLALKYFFLLVFVLSVPFWLMGANKLPIPVNLPVSALMVFNPLIAALTLTYIQDGFGGIKELVEKAFDYKKIKNKIWYVPILFLVPLLYFLSYVIMHLAGLPLPDPKIPFLMVPVFFSIYFVTAIGEELGWMGYAIDPMQERWGALKASILLGLVWVIWHIIPHLQQSLAASWILWQSLYSIALRILIVWIYNNTGNSVFAAILVHTMDNVSWSLFPNYGSHYDPFVTSIITWLVAVIVTLGWGPKTLGRYRHARASRL
jgi:uncharacterized protein